MAAARRILLADDHAVVRRELRGLIESSSDWSVCAEATNGSEAVEQARVWQPEVALLDLALPDLSGFEATRRIHYVAPHTRVLILTTHPEDELAVEAQRAGAEGVLPKSDADSILAAIGNGGAHAEAIHLGGAVVGRARHIGGLFASEDERYEILAPFVAEGLDRGERAFHVVEGGRRASHEERLTRAGIDVGRVEIASCDDMYLLGGHFDMGAQRKRIESVLTDSAEAGFPMTRLVAHMEWALQDCPGVGDLVEYETRLNYDLPAFDDVVVCAYDLTRFDANVIVDIMRAHPAVILGGELHQNAFYVPPDKMLRQLRERRDRSA